MHASMLMKSTDYLGLAFLSPPPPAYPQTKAWSNQTCFLALSSHNSWRLCVLPFLKLMYSGTPTCVVHAQTHICTLVLYLCTAWRSSKFHCISPFSILLTLPMHVTRWQGFNFMLQYKGKICQYFSQRYTFTLKPWMMGYLFWHKAVGKHFWNSCIWSFSYGTSEFTLLGWA